MDADSLEEQAIRHEVNSLAKNRSTLCDKMSHFRLLSVTRGCLLAAFL